MAPTLDVLVLLFDWIMNKNWWMFQKVVLQFSESLIFAKMWAINGIWNYRRVETFLRLSSGVLKPVISELAAAQNFFTDFIAIQIRGN